MANPKEMKYSKTHEWVHIEDGVALVGITDHAQAELGDVTYIDLPETGRYLKSSELFGEIESVKAVSELFSPVEGEVIESNSDILNATEIVNEDPFGRGWLIKVRLEGTEGLSNLMNADEYELFAAQGGH